MTQTNPSDWDGRSSQTEIDKTWCIHTYDGDMYINRHSTPCHPWKQRFGDEHWPAVLDTLSLTLCDDRSVSITYNDTQVSNMFGRLPHGPFWVVLWGPDMEIVQPRQLEPKPLVQSDKPGNLYKYIGLDSIGNNKQYNKYLYMYISILARPTLPDIYKCPFSQ